MALQNISLDDRSFDQLLEVLRKHIRGEEWSDHNPSDPGITLLELLAWQAEMTLYRMDRVPPAHRRKFLDLVIDPPEPATVDVTFTLAPPRSTPFELPAGILLATDFDSDGRRRMFETIATCRMRPPSVATGLQQARVPAREYLEVTDEALDPSDGTPGQVRRLSPPRRALRLAEDAPLQVLVDFVHRTSAYDPNPQIKVFDGFPSGVAAAGALSSANGFAAFEFDGSQPDSHAMVSFDAPTRMLRLTKPDGSFAEQQVAAAPIAPDATEAVDLAKLGVRVVLNASFDKLTSLSASPNVATGTPAPPPILPASIRIVEVKGTVSKITSPTLTLTRLTDPTDLKILTDGGFRGSFDGSSAGTKRVALRDAAGNELIVEFDVGPGVFIGNETAATIELNHLDTVVVLGSKIWELKRSLLTAESKVERADPSGPSHFAFDPTTGEIRFGDGVFGAVPRSGCRMVCRRYQLLQGPPALVHAGELVHILTVVPGLQAGETLTIGHEDAAGGAHFYSSAEREARGLEAFRRPFRLVTIADFERVLQEDFNEFQRLSRSQPQLLRAIAVMNRRPPLATATEKPGHVTVLVLPEADPNLDARLRAERDPENDETSVAGKQDLLEPLPELEQKILHFLDARRLVTTRVHLDVVTLKGLEMTTSVAIRPERSVPEMRERIRKRVYDFLSLLPRSEPAGDPPGGYFGRGWPLGRAVHRSELFRVIEELEGVDHVNSLVLTPAGRGGKFEIGPHELPILQKLNLSVERS